MEEKAREAEVFEMSGQRKSEFSTIRDELSGMLDHVPLATLLLDADRRVQRASRPATDLAGRAHDEMTGLRYGEALGCIHECEDPRGCGFASSCATCVLQRTLMDTLETGRRYQAVPATLCLSRTGREHEVDLTLSTARIQAGDGTQVVMCLQDRTLPRRTEETTQKIEASLTEAQRIAHLGNWDWDIISKDLWWSDEIFRIFGLDAQEFGATYDAFLESVHPEDRESVERGVERALNHNEPYSIDHRIVLPDGSERIVHEQAEIFRDEAGRVVRMIGTVQDITERKHLERILLQRQEALESIYKVATTMETSFATVCDEIVTSLARLLNVPHAVARTFEDNEVKVLAWMADGKISHEGSSEVMCGPCGTVLKKKATCQFEGNLRERFPGSVCLSRHDLKAYLGVPIRSSARETIGILCVMDHEERSFGQEESYLIEIFARYLAFEIQHARMDSELQRAQRMKVLGQLTSGVAHEVRNPLNAILAISEALHEDLRDDPEHGEYLAQIRVQVDRLSRLMRELLDLGKPIRESDLRIEPLRAVCASAIDLWKQTGSYPEHPVCMVDPSEPKDLSVLCDSAKIQQVLLNLLDNAAEHSSPGSDISVTISEPQIGTVRVSVIDQGIGVSPEGLQQIFEPFFTTRKGGTGLGLSIVRNIVEMHGGKVRMMNNDSVPGCTVEFTLRLRSRQ
jgi:PAS domain S-box-containing protein